MYDSYGRKREGSYPVHSLIEFIKIVVGVFAYFVVQFEQYERRCIERPGWLPLHVRPCFGKPVEVVDEETTVQTVHHVAS